MSSAQTSPPPRLKDKRRVSPDSQSNQASSLDSEEAHSSPSLECTVCRPVPKKPTQLSSKERLESAEDSTQKITDKDKEESGLPSGERNLRPVNLEHNADESTLVHLGNTAFRAVRNLFDTKKNPAQIPACCGWDQCPEEYALTEKSLNASKSWVSDNNWSQQNGALSPNFPKISSNISHGRSYLIGLPELLSESPTSEIAQPCNPEQRTSNLSDQGATKEAVPSPFDVHEFTSVLDECERECKNSQSAGSQDSCQAHENQIVGHTDSFPDHNKESNRTLSDLDLLLIENN
ncbi:unnamed protein product [Calicophoron daubneyi]|uniref:BTB and CNC homology 1 n=1 Tax=Calicophoron daubneyi TaxID=300641 RepID=A0AAV2TS10_CALDB